MSEPLSFKQDTTCCRHCEHQKLLPAHNRLDYGCSYSGVEAANGLILWMVNKYRLTPSCPAWQAQQKEKTE